MQLVTGGLEAEFARSGFWSQPAAMSHVHVSVCCPELACGILQAPDCPEAASDVADVSALLQGADSRMAAGRSSSEKQRLPHCCRVCASCRAVAVAIDSSLPQAMLTATIYVASSAATPAGLRQLRCMLSEWLTSPSAAAAASEVTAAPGEDLEGEEAAAASSVPPDAYLQAPTVPDSWAPIVTFVAVPALPKGALVELQPTAVRASGGTSSRRCTAGLTVCCREVVRRGQQRHLHGCPQPVWVLVVLQVGPATCDAVAGLGSLVQELPGST